MYLLIYLLIYLLYAVLDDVALLMLAVTLLMFSSVSFLLLNHGPKIYSTVFYFFSTLFYYTDICPLSILTAIWF